ncbi:hypothetical protein K474DRAFT_1658767 [Panus rudis PR-1116 ss-1]|nr:hypothetical protein K474DRAFT_1658767 [Panus rudis PR-1116 ss-1]
MSLLAARVPRRLVVGRRATFVPARLAHSGEYKHLPFEYKHKRAFGLKVASYMIGGFTIPFIAAAYQLHKAGGSA